MLYPLSYRGVDGIVSEQEVVDAWSSASPTWTSLCRCVAACVVRDAVGYSAIGLMSRARSLLPKRWGQVREMGVALCIDVDVGDDGSSGALQRRPINLLSASNENVAGTRSERYGRSQRFGAIASGMRPPRISRQHNRATPGQGSTDRIKGLSPHDEGVAKCGGLEMAQILRQVPRQGVVAADHTVSGPCNDQCDARRGCTHEPTANSDGNRCFDVRVGLVADDFEVLKPIAEDVIRAALDLEAGKGHGRAGKLGLGLLEMIELQVAVATGPDKIPRLEIALLGHHVGEEGVGGDIERHTQKNIGASLIHLT